MTAGSAFRALHEILPREQVGAVTGERYEFQYHQAAADALLVLDEGSVVCVYCEWHDDYVVESSGDVAYRFHQVKTRGLHRGPWKLTDFFGHRRRAPSAKSRMPSKSASSDDSEGSIGTRMIEHMFTFGDRCAAFAFVTDAGIHPDFQALLDAIVASPALDALSKAHKKKHLRASRGD